MNNNKRRSCCKCTCGCVPCCCLRGPRGERGPQGPQGEPGESTLLNLVDGNALGSVRGINTSDNYEMGVNAVAIGEGTVASGDISFASGLETTASDFVSFAEGYQTVANGLISHAEGAQTLASGDVAHSEGLTTVANGIYTHAEGWNTTASGGTSHAECLATNATGNISHAEGYATNAEGLASHAEGYITIAGGNYSHTSNYYTRAVNDFQTAIGRYNVLSNPDNNGAQIDDAFIIGNGSPSAGRSNAFRVQFNGDVHAAGTYTSGGADYAEMFEWADGNPKNENRVGCFVAFDERQHDKIRIAHGCDNDYIIGVISAAPTMVGDAQACGWHKMYLHDKWGKLKYERATETVQVPDLALSNLEAQNDCNCPDCVKEKLKARETLKLKTETVRVCRPVLNPSYDKDREYSPRAERPEWAAVGLMGKLIVRSDGSPEAGGYCAVGECGAATKSERGYRVLKRIDDECIVILLK